MIARLIRVQGKVQGVGFRESLRREAERLEVTGWVRNRADLSVEAFLQGDESKVLALVEWARSGPPHARVTNVKADDSSPDPSLKVFERRSTV